MIQIVIVEDDPMVAEINRRYLDKLEGFQLVGMASTVETAIPILENHQVDLVLLDIHMPGDNGWTLLSKIRGMGSETDVIIITASCDKESIKKGLRFGATDYIIKPFEFHRFQAALLSYQKEQTIMDCHQQLNQSELDQLLYPLTSAPKGEKSDLPKGLTRGTLQKVCEQLNLLGNVSFSTEELACKVGISRVSMRKYVSFLADIRQIETDIVYGTVGRPVYMHRVIEENKELINQFI